MSIMVDGSTKVLVQGITGSAGSFHAKQMLEYGTPGWSPASLRARGGQKFEGKVPIFRHRRSGGCGATGAKRERGVSCRLRSAADSLMEAADARVPLVICITEGIPVADMVRAKRFHHVDVDAACFGPNCPGVITPGGKCKIGIMPGPHSQARPHRPSSRAGGNPDVRGRVFSSPTWGSGSRRAVGIGGDPVNGTNFIDVLKMFNADSEDRRG